MPPQFIAYVYPGWHPDPYRPGVDEWKLLDQFQPYFAGHLPPAQPVGGRYDDTNRALASRQISQARAAGVTGFTYFLYWGPDGFVMDRPMEVARDVAAEHADGFMIGGTWCVRLPHSKFPVVAEDALAPPEEGDSSVLAAEDRRIDQLTIGDFERLIPEWGDSWLEMSATPPVRRRERPPASTDVTAPEEERSAL